jgi:hypothetical protein
VAFYSLRICYLLVPPGLKGVFSNGNPIIGEVIPHEYLHAYQFSMGLTGYGIYSEKSTSTYNLAYAKHYNFNVDYINLARYQIGNYPAAFSWRVMDRLGIINMGIH